MSRVGLTVLLIFGSSSLCAYDNNWIWEVSCQEKDHGTLHQYRVSTDMLQRRTDLGVWSIEPFYPTQEVLVSGSDTHLYISTLGDSTRDPITIHLTWWNYSNPSEFNSYVLTPYWSHSGAVTTSVQYLNCVADKNPSEDFNNRIGFITRNGDVLHKRNLDGTVWTEYSKSQDKERSELIKKNEMDRYEYLQKKLGK